MTVNNTLASGIIDPRTGKDMYDPMEGLSGYAKRLWLEHRNLSKNHVREAARLESTKHTAQMTKVELAKVYAAHHGDSSREGGWIYTSWGDPIVQGWVAYASRLAARRIIVVGKGINWNKTGL